MFEDVNNCSPYTDLISKMVRYYGFLYGMYEMGLIEFVIGFNFITTIDI